MRSKLLVSFLFSTLLGCGVDSPETPATLTSTAIEPMGAHCAAGGVATHTGLDENGNGTLDAAEVYTTTYTCLHSTLLREDALASGSVCPGGGVLVRSGHDINDNASLEDSEIEQTVTVCHSDEIYRGDLKTSEFKTTEAGARLSHVRVVTGDVVFDSAAAMPALEMAGGNIEIRTEELVELPALQQIAGKLFGPHPVPFGAQGASRGARFKAPLLASIGGDVSLSTMTDGGIFSAPSLTTVDGQFFLSGKITTVELDKLARVAGQLDFDVQVATLSLPALQQVGGNVAVSGWFTALDLHALQTAGGFDLVYSKLDKLSLPALKTASLVRVGQSATLASVEMPLVSGVRSLTLFDLPKLAFLDLPLVTELDKLSVSRLGTADLGLFSNLRAIKALTIQSNAQLTDLGGLDQLTTAASLSISGNGKLVSLAGLDHIATVTNTVLITNNASLADLKGLSTLTNVGGLITISNNAALPQSEVDAFLHRLGR